MIAKISLDGKQPISISSVIIGTQRIFRMQDLGTLTFCLLCLLSENWIVKISLDISNVVHVEPFIRIAEFEKFIAA